MAEPHTTPDAPSALAQYQALLIQYAAEGYSTLSAYEAIERAFPGLGQAADNEVRRRTRAGEFPQAPYATR